MNDTEITELRNRIELLEARERRVRNEHEHLLKLLLPDTERLRELEELQATGDDPETLQSLRRSLLLQLNLLQQIFVVVGKTVERHEKAEKLLTETVEAVNHLAKRVNTIEVALSRVRQSGRN